MEPLDTIIPIFGIMVIGWILRRMGIIDKRGVKTLSDYAYYIGFPLLVFVSLYKIDFVAMLDHRLYLANFISIFLVTSVA